MGASLTLKAFVEFYLSNRVAVLVGEVVELGLELVGVNLGHLREGGDGGREEDEQTGADQSEVHDAGEGARGRDHLGALQESQRERREDEGRNCRR